MCVYIFLAALITAVVLNTEYYLCIMVQWWTDLSMNIEF